MSNDIKLPELGQTYNLIATYSVRHDHLSDIDRLSKWQELINSIKDYARAAVELNRAWLPIKDAPKDGDILATDGVETIITTWLGGSLGWYHSGDLTHGLKDWEPTLYFPLPKLPEHGEGK